MPDKSPITRRSRGICDCAELRHRIAVANRFALAVRPLIDDLRKQFPLHPAVLAFDDYAEVAIGSAIIAGVARMEGAVQEPVEIRETCHRNSEPRQPTNWPYVAEETEKR